MWEIRNEISGRHILENGDIQFSGYSGLHSQQLLFFFFLFFRETTGQIQTPEPIIRSIHATDQSQVAMTLRLGCILFVPQVCRCLVAVPMCCGYTYSP